MQKLQTRRPQEIRVGDRLNHAGVIVVVDSIEERSTTFKVSYTYQDARYTSGSFFVTKDASLTVA